MKNKFILLFICGYFILSCKPQNEDSKNPGWLYNEIRNELREEINSENSDNLCTKEASFDSKTISQFRKCRMSLNKNLEFHIDTTEYGYHTYFLLEGELHDYSRKYNKEERLQSQRKYNHGLSLGWEEDYNHFGDLKEKRRYFSKDKGTEILEEKKLFDNGTLREGEGFYLEAVLTGYENDQDLRIWFEGDYYNLKSVDLKLQFERNGKKST
jgi:hypothetical protein